MSIGNLRDVTISSEELSCLILPKRVPAKTIAERIRLPLRGNILDRIDLTLTPYLLEPMGYIGDSEVEWIGVFAPTQSGKSVLLQVAVADCIDQDPGPLFYLLPDETSGKKQIKEKIIAMIDKSEFLTQHKTDRKFDISQKEIALDNMTITTGWAGSLGRMSSTPYKRVVLDEVRLMKLAVGELLLCTDAAAPDFHVPMLYFPICGPAVLDVDPRGEVFAIEKDDGVRGPSLIAREQTLSIRRPHRDQQAK